MTQNDTGLPLIEIDINSALATLPRGLTITLDGVPQRDAVAASEFDGWVERLTGACGPSGFCSERLHGTVRIGGVTDEQRARFAMLHPDKSGWAATAVAARPPLPSGIPRRSPDTGPGGDVTALTPAGNLIRGTLVAPDRIDTGYGAPMPVDPRSVKPVSVRE